MQNYWEITENSFYLIVMRLSRPMLASTDFITSDPWDLPGQFDSIATDPLQDEFTKQIPLAGTSLILPQSFGYYPFSFLLSL